MKLIRTYIPVCISLIMLIIGMIVEKSGAKLFINTPTGSFIWYLIDYLPVATPVIVKALKSIMKKDFFNEFMLMTLATLGAFYVGAYPEGVAVMLFYTIGELVQDRAVDKAQHNIKALLDLRPVNARMICNEVVKLVNPQEVKIGDTIEIRTGERVPLDGIITDGKANFDTAALTGESVPQKVSIGEEVLAGMIDLDATVQIRVKKPYSESALSRILSLVEEASERKAPAENFITKLARIYTPTVVLLAVAIATLPYFFSLFSTFDYVFSDWFYRGLIFLVVSCPCALVISIPLGYFGGIGLASRNGILFKGSNYIDAIVKVNTLFMDKTGTLTQGVFKVQQIVTKEINKNTFLNYVASAEQHSTHPIAKAIAECAKERNIEISNINDCTEKAGFGISAKICDKNILVGNTKMLDLYKIPYPTMLDEIPETTVVCAINGIYAGHIIVADALKKDSKKAMDELHKMQLTHIVMLSGDKEQIVKKTAKALEIKEAHGNLLPEQKVAYIAEAKKEKNNIVAFVGDGINDAPVLALSDIGIAMGGLGADAAIESADVVIQTDNPSKIATAIKIGHITRKVVWENVIAALSVKLIVMLLAALGVATLWEAVFADVGVAILAVANATKILYKKVD